ncbi:MAG TPA: ROK family protein [Kiritimatiellia bacterium]|nr:ROK family protein [Kiritimatiellia bacterium]
MTNHKPVWIGFDLGGTKMMCVVYDHDFRPLGKKRRKTKGMDGADAGLERIAKTIDEALLDANVPVESLHGIGCGIPGPLDLEKGIILESPNLGWKNLKFQEWLEARYKCPAVLANDVDAGTFGEYKFGAGKGGRCVLGVFPGTGIGGACVYEGKLLRGRNMSCMEIGHMQVDPRGRICGCGRRGCLETVASRLAIAADCAIAAYRGEAPALLRLAGADLAGIRSGILALAINQGDTIVEEIVRQAARRIGISIADVCNLLAPDRIVLGGGLVEAMDKLFVEEVSQAIIRHAMKSFRKQAKVVPAQLGDDAGALGAAALAADHVTSRPPTP